MKSNNKLGKILQEISDLNEDIIRSRLSSAPNNKVDNPYPPAILKAKPRPAAVLIPMLKKEDVWHILYIRRTQNQYDPHSGQVAFPGGAADEGDTDAISTALREANEEIGLNQYEVKILGRLNTFHTITNYLVTPVVALIEWPLSLNPAPLEVSRVFTIPLEWLAGPNNFEIKSRQVQGLSQPIPVIYYQPYSGEILWGASARFTMGLLEILLGIKVFN